MDWRSILKFDENLYNHTDESTKEKHQRILDFLKDRPKTKRTGLRIKQFLDSGELDESFTPFDLPRNSITEKTKEYYKELGDFRDSKNKVNDLVNTYSNMFRVYRDEIEREMGGMPLRDFTLAFSKLVKNFYYSEMPKLNIDMVGFLEEARDKPMDEYKNIHPSVRSMPSYEDAVANYLNKFETLRQSDLLLHLVNRALEYFLPTSHMSTMSSMNIRQDLGNIRE